MELVAQNLVLTAKQLNPSIISQLWLVKNEVVREDEFTSGCVFSEAVANVVGNDFQMIVLPNALQLSINPKFDGDVAAIVAKVAQIARKLPHTPYTAIGVNFTYHFAPRRESVHDLTRRLFFRADTKAFAAFDVPDARFGCYLSKDHDGGRLKLDIKPIRGTSELGVDEQRVLLNFNFHWDLNPDKPVAGIEGAIAGWAGASETAKGIVNEIEKLAEAA